jgi:hypothetical protein
VRHTFCSTLQSQKALYHPCVYPHHLRSPVSHGNFLDIRGTNLQCDDCGRSFIRRDQLRAHHARGNGTRCAPTETCSPSLPLAREPAGLFASMSDPMAPNLAQQDALQASILRLDFSTLAPPASLDQALTTPALTFGSSPMTAPHVEFPDVDPFILLGDPDFSSFFKDSGDVCTVLANILVVHHRCLPR